RTFSILQRFSSDFVNKDTIFYASGQGFDLVLTNCNA
ncbi:MAG: hypothetical protein ACJAUX_000664, partial [Flavobacteriales bacterium]